MGWSALDKRFMRRAIRLASRGEGNVSPNPLVGAVVVKGGRVIGEGWHEKFGGPHAEANALRGIDAQGATIYVTLEPCCPSVPGKKTPACTPLIIRSGIARVAIGTRDLHPHVSGIEQLRSSGIRVEEGLLRTEARRLNEPSIVFHKSGRAFCIAKMAQSADGFIGIRGKRRVWLSGRKFDRLSQRMRNRYDAILVGINTVLVDNPRLTCRMKNGRNPARIILDDCLRIPIDAKALSNAKEEKVIIATSEQAGMEKARLLRKMGAEVLVMGKRQAGLKRLLYHLPKLGIISVLIEGGAQVISSALEEGVVDKAVVAVSAKKIEGKGAIASPFSAAILKKFAKRRMGADTVYEGYLTSYSK
ncbi:2,5-diamino-6-ribosylamino-4(3H)-pyrimidinone 5'-phosphate reductase [uncultured archaeon]|nr:2,5-diamino-6-ribosylamino-4(3H)-pyrimidinone 5'-phosphate reductase [uncultured archaeon]